MAGCLAPGSQGRVCARLRARLGGRLKAVCPGSLSLWLLWWFTSRVKEGEAVLGTPVAGGETGAGSQ